MKTWGRHFWGLQISRLAQTAPQKDPPRMCDIMLQVERDLVVKGTVAPYGATNESLLPEEYCSNSP